MKPPFFLRLDLRRLILTLAMASVLLTLGNSFYATYEVQRALLIANTLESHRVYAAKLAETTNNFLASTEYQLAHGAELLGTMMGNEQALRQETRRLHRQSKSFNSLVVVNADAKVVATSPETLQLLGLTLDSDIVRQSLEAKRPLTSDPFVSVTGNYLISVTHPIITDKGDYLGFVSGSVYLQDESMLGQMLGSHYYNDDSYLYVVDRKGTVLYHPDEACIGEKIIDNSVVDAVLEGHSGSLQLTDTDGTEMLAGYAPVTKAGWGIVAQRPRASALAGLDGQILDVFIKSLPLALLTLVFIWFSALFIATPLRQLAHNARTMDQKQAQDNIAQVRSWYFEAALLKRAILKGVSLLNDKISRLHADSHCDPLTGLLNRRGMQKVLDHFQETGQTFAAIALDIDHFKRVNDTHGHGVGDQVITSLAKLMQNSARKDDALCRSGGEEFLLFLPGADTRAAREVAERLRGQTQKTQYPGVGHVTISLGIAHWPGSPSTIDNTLKMADKALYQAKRQGRNQTVVATG
ncbi:sensor domain-containing diguanylate cyclase [Zobellella sp. An-6]|uniref:sensor domain-containing diguanylate cyclase n=1 Tax=Zobellella sp. An-6 TaxID=3400218 RepID=UPI004041E8BB